MIALAVLSIVASIVHINGLDPRIINGKPAPEGKYPYQVSVKENPSPGAYLICGGSLISQRYVLTAAHCIYRKAPTHYTVTVGTIYLFDKGDIYAAEKLIWHEQYDPKLIYNDIGLIRVNKDISFNKKVSPIPISTVYDVPTNATGVLTGWGKLSPNGVVSKILQEVNVTVISQSLCNNRTTNSITANNICTFTRLGQGGCNGDSGGPLVVNNTQVGIVSYVIYNCAAGFPDVYTRVYPYRDWINDTMRKNNNAGSLYTQPALLFAASMFALRLHLSL